MFRKTDWMKVLIDIGARKVGCLWKMASGKFSVIEYDIWRLYQYPNLYSRACRDLLRKAGIKKLTKDTWFIGLERDGIALALELARQTGASAGFATKKEGGAELKEFELPPGANVYLVVDVNSSGGTFVETRTALEQYDIKVLNPILALVNRSGKETVSICRHMSQVRTIVSLVETNEPGTWGGKE